MEGRLWMLKSWDHFSQHLCFLPWQSLNYEAQWSEIRPSTVLCTCLGPLLILVVRALKGHGPSSSSETVSSHLLLMKESFVFQGKICRPPFLLLISRAEYMVSQERTWCYVLLCTNVAPETWRTKAAWNGFANQLLCSKDCLQHNQSYLLYVFLSKMFPPSPLSWN